MTVVLVVLDGFGIGDDPKRNALLSARMPNWDRLRRDWPTARLAASGEAVGLPVGQMGNSEVGHLNLGAGFPVLQDLPRISRAIADGTFGRAEALVAARDAAVGQGTRLHVMGLIGPGGVHAIDDHIAAIFDLAATTGLPPERLLLHAFTDGRDTPPRSANRYLPELLDRLNRCARLATVSGRYYAMDRDARWERTRLAYEAIVHGVGRRVADADAALRAAEKGGEGDEFVTPTVIGDYAGMTAGDIVIHANFRADRARQLTQALALDRFGSNPRDVHITTLTAYQAPADLPVSVAFGPIVVDSLAAHLARFGKRQLHVAETEKYAHVTYFFNGGIEAPFPGEDRVLVPSNRSVATYDLAPEMSAPAITDVLIDGIRSRSHDFIVTNYANADMVGHTGVWDAAVRAAEALDACLGMVADAADAAADSLVITADHGNIEQMRDAAGNPQTKHTTSPVPIVAVGSAVRGRRLRDGALSDVAPTLCELLDIPPGPEMTGHLLLD